MEENKYICPKCGAEMVGEYEKPALNLICNKCGCKIASTKWEDIDLDDTDYEIFLKPHISSSIDQIKIISKLTGQNYIYSKNLLEKGGFLSKAKAIDLKGGIILLKKSNLEYFVLPEFRHKI